MKISGFTFLRNAHSLGYPFIQSIRSILPIVDEFVIALGPSDDETEKMINEIGSNKVRLLHTQWNENMKDAGFVYAQQTNLALNNCTGDWAFYLQSDEVVHENDLPVIEEALHQYLNDDRVEALIFDYIHFYGNPGTYAWSPAWYRRESRILKNSIRIMFPSDGQFPVVLTSTKKSRYPRAALSGAKIYHYGWVRSEKQMNAKLQHVGKYWGRDDISEVNYADIDNFVLREFKGTHPALMKEWLPEAKGIFQADPNHTLTFRELKHRCSLMIEKLLGVDLSKKHYKLIT